MRKTAWLVSDLGGGLFDFHGVAGIAELTGLSKDAAHDALVNSRAVHALETGGIDAETFAQRFAVACVSNNNALNWGILRTRFNAHALFDKCYLSHEIGLQKPDPQIFEHVVADLDADATQITYFGDRLDIVESATAFGFNAHQVAGPKDIRAVLGTN